MENAAKKFNAWRRQWTPQKRHLATTLKHERQQMLFEMWMVKKKDYTMEYICDLCHYNQIIYSSQTHCVRCMTKIILDS